MKRNIELERPVDEVLRTLLSEALTRLKAGQQLIIARDRFRKLWPEESDEELLAKFNTNDLNQHFKLTAVAHDCRYKILDNGDLVFIKES